MLRSVKSLPSSFCVFQSAFGARRLRVQSCSSSSHNTALPLALDFAFRAGAKTLRCFYWFMSVGFALLD
eukprot:4026180-Amphidinium_carterae.1